jgi:hypothetical protein
MPGFAASETAPGDNGAMHVLLAFGTRVEAEAAIQKTPAFAHAAGAWFVPPQADAPQPAK